MATQTTTTTPSSAPNSHAANVAAPNPNGEVRALTIRVSDADRNGITFKVKPNIPLKRVMKAYCEHRGRALPFVRFHFVDVKVLPENTPTEVILFLDCVVYNLLLRF